MTWTDAVASEAVSEGTAHVVEADGRRIAVCNVEGEFYAIADVCTHDGGPLDQGELVGNRIECPRHGAQFDVTTGRALTLPAVRPVKTYPVRVCDGRIEIEVT